jgi:hypothetical protein
VAVHGLRKAAVRGPENGKTYENGRAELQENLGMPDTAGAARRAVDRRMRALADHGRSAPLLLKENSALLDLYPEWRE